MTIVRFTCYIEVDTTDVDGISDMDWAVMHKLMAEFQTGFDNADDFYGQLKADWEIVDEK